MRTRRPEMAGVAWRCKALSRKRFRVAVETRLFHALSASVTAASSRSRRSEERRVGKEWRSRCDWSSDVCSSDLVALQGAFQETVQGGGGNAAVPRPVGFGDGGFQPVEEIGRASCRERVEITV